MVIIVDYVFAYPCQPSLTAALKSRIIYLGLSFTGDVAGGPLAGFRWGLAPAFHLQTPVFTCLEGFFFPRRLVDKLWIMCVTLVCSVIGGYCSMGWGWISIFSLGRGRQGGCKGCLYGRFMGIEAVHPHPSPLPEGADRGRQGGYKECSYGRLMGIEAFHPHPSPLPKGEGAC